MKYYMTKFRRIRGWEDQEKYDSSEEEFNCHGEEIGPCRRTFATLDQIKRTYVSNTTTDKEATTTHSPGTRKLEEIRPSYLFKPTITQEEFYSEAITRLLIAKHQSKNLWRLVNDSWFHDGRIPGFMMNPAADVHFAINQEIACFRDTMATLN